MDYNLFWTAFGAIGGTVGALATTAAVIVALWQTKYANTKKLKVDFSDIVSIIPHSGDISKVKKYVGITVTNTGNRNIKLCDWRIILPNNKGAIIVQDVTPMGKLISPPWPMIIEPENQTSQYWEKHLFYTYIKDEFPKLKSSERKRKLKFVVKDSTGKTYTTKSKKTVQEYYDEIK